MNGDCRLAVAVIARNEARCIRRCLDSVRGLADRVVLVDTGSTDATVALAAECGAEVHHHVWRDDFSAARNHASALTRAAWSLVIDADEWLIAGQDELAMLRSGDAPFVGQVAVRSYVTDGAAQTNAGAVTSWISRLLPAGVHYAGSVHEQPVHRWPVRRTGIALAHDGYAPAQRAGKGDRNRRLLEQAIADRPGDGYLAYQLGKDHELAGRYAEAARRYAQAWDAADPAAPWCHDLLLRRLYALKCLARHGEALQLGEPHVARWAGSPDVYFALGDVLLDWAATEPARAGELLPMAEACWQRCTELGECDRYEGAVAGRGSDLAAHNLAVLCEGTGRADQAAAWRLVAARTQAR